MVNIEKAEFPGKTLLQSSVVLVHFSKELTKLPLSLLKK